MGKGLAEDTKRPEVSSTVIKSCRELRVLLVFLDEQALSVRKVRGT